MKLPWTKLIIVTWLFLIMLSFVPSAIEGEIYPPISDVHKISLRSDGGDTPQIAFTFRIQRECKVLNTRVYYQFAYNLRPNYKTINFSNHPNDSNYKTVVIDIPTQIYRNMTEIYVMSNCHPLWLTATKVYG